MPSSFVDKSGRLLVRAFKSSTGIPQTSIAHKQADDIQQKNEDQSATRERILEIIKRNPGCHLRQIKREIQATNGTTQYHLFILEKERKIVSVRSGRYRRFYTGLLFNEKDHEILSMLLSDTIREIIVFLIERPGSNQKQICEHISLSTPTVSWHLKRLKASGLITESREGRSVTYSLTIDPAQVLQIMKTCRPTIWKKWSERVGTILGEISEG